MKPAFVAMLFAAIWSSRAYIVLLHTYVPALFDTAAATLARSIALTMRFMGSVA